MKQTSTLTRNLAAAQEAHAERQRRAEDSAPIVFRLYTEQAGNLGRLTARYFSGATLIPATGLWAGAFEDSTIIEVVGTIDDLQRVVFLAGDVRDKNQQTSVLVTWQRLDGQLDVQS